MSPRGEVRCRTGTAVRTSAKGSLGHNYDAIFHTVAPFRSSPTWHADLVSCYHHVLNLATEAGSRTVACPLLGSGARGASHEESCVAAAKALLSWQRHERHKAANTPALRMCIVQEDVVGMFEEALDGALARSSSGN